MDLTAGSSTSFEKTFTVEDVRTFAELSGDRGRQHVEPDADGRLMVHGLLTAMLPTKLGGDLHYIAATMDFRFLRPVFTGDTITTTGTIANVERTDERVNLDLQFQCTNQHGKDVLTGRTTGFVPVALSP